MERKKRTGGDETGQKGNREMTVLRAWSFSSANKSTNEDEPGLFESKRLKNQSCRTFFFLKILAVWDKAQSTSMEGTR